MLTSNPEIRDLLGPDPGAKKSLAGRVSTSQGKLFILVHPFFNEDNQEDAAYPHAFWYTQRRDGLIRACLSNGLALLIMEEASQMSKLPGRLPTDLSGEIFTVTTEEDEPIPLKPFQAFIETLQALHNPQQLQIFVAGQYLFFDDAKIYGLDSAKEASTGNHSKASYTPWLHLGLVPQGCVGVLARDLHRRFNVKIMPDLSSPTTRFEPTNYKHMMNSKISTASPVG